MAKIWMAAVTSKDAGCCCERVAVIQKTAVFLPSAQCASKRPCTAEKDKLTLGRLWSIEDLVEHSTDFSVLERLYNTSKTKSRTFWV